MNIKWLLTCVLQTHVWTQQQHITAIVKTSLLKPFFWLFKEVWSLPAASPNSFRVTRVHLCRSARTASKGQSCFEPITFPSPPSCVSPRPSVSSCVCRSFFSAKIKTPPFFFGAKKMRASVQLASMLTPPPPVSITAPLICAGEKQNKDPVDKCVFMCENAHKITSGKDYKCIKSRIFIWFISINDCF